MMYQTIDLKFLGLTEAIASFMIESADGIILIETGPYNTLAILEKELEKYGHKLKDVKHVLLTHIHFDHAGGAWKLAEYGAKIYVHPAGLSHMCNPEKLVASATRIYGDDMERLWGKMSGIRMEQLIEVMDQQILHLGGHDIEALHTPGHATHHIAWKMGKTIFSGDVGGVKIAGGPVVPPCPPPDIDVEDWHSSIEKILACEPSELVLTHFGPIANPLSHMESLKTELKAWSEWIFEHMNKVSDQAELTQRFQKFTAERMNSAGVDPGTVERYHAANPSWMSVAGLCRYWKKKG